VEKAVSPNASLPFLQFLPFLQLLPPLVALGRPRQRDLQPDELSTIRVAVLFEPVSVHQPRRVVVGVGNDVVEQAVARRRHGASPEVTDTGSEQAVLLAGHAHRTGQVLRSERWFAPDDWWEQELDDPASEGKESSREESHCSKSLVSLAGASGL
jgi:hypothetical protein